MRTARTLPKESVTGSFSCSCQRWLWVVGKIDMRGARGESGGDARRLGRARGARLSAYPGEPRPQGRRTLLGELGERVPDHPRSASVVMGDGPLGLVGAKQSHGLDVDEDQAAKGRWQRLLDIWLAVADQAGDEGQAVLGDDRVAATPPIDERDRGDRRSDEAALPARRREHQLLELRPAIGLEEDPFSGRVGQRVD